MVSMELCVSFISVHTTGLSVAVVLTVVLVAAFRVYHRRAMKEAGKCTITKFSSNALNMTPFNRKIPFGGHFRNSGYCIGYSRRMTFSW